MLMCKHKHITQGLYCICVWIQDIPTVLLKKEKIQQKQSRWVTSKGIFPTLKELIFHTLFLLNI